MNRPVAYNALNSVVRIVLGPITAVLIALHFSIELQGYFYTFGSLLALQTFAELGLGMIIVQFASHEWSALQFDERGHLVARQPSLDDAQPEALSRLISLGRLGLTWFLVAGCLSVLALGIVGTIFFGNTDLHSSFASVWGTARNSGIRWMGAWWTLCLLTGIRLWLLPVWSLLEGCNQLLEVYRMRFLEGLIATVMLWLGIQAGLGLWASVVSTATALTCSGFYLLFRYRTFLGLFLRPPGGPVIDWRQDLWPMQWRIALSWIAGYVLFSLFTPVIFRTCGPAEAGRMGMTWSLVAAVQGVSTAWVVTRAPSFGMLIAQRKWDELDALFTQIARASILVATFLALAAWGLVWVVNYSGSRYATRLLPLAPTAFFLLGTLSSQMSVPMSIYLRAHKREAYLGPSLASSFLVGLATLLLARDFGPAGVGLAYFIVNLLTLGWCIVIFRKCRVEWHGQPGGIVSDLPETTVTNPSK